MNPDYSRLILAADKAAALATSERQARQAEAQHYLAQTDWMVIRAIEGGAPVPPDIVQLRAAARHVASQ